MNIIPTYDLLGIYSIADNLPPETIKAVEKKIKEIEDHARYEIEQFLINNDLENNAGEIVRKENVGYNVDSRSNIAGRSEN